ncbi:hypothetical protein C3L33_15782, partial [Rhododendron williamsianum]
MGSFGNPSPSSKKQQQQQKQKREWFAVSFKPENFIPGLVIGSFLGCSWTYQNPPKEVVVVYYYTNTSNRLLGKHQQQRMAALDSYEELKMVLVVRQDLKMGAGKIALNVLMLPLVIFRTGAQSAVPFETMGAMWATQNSRHMQESAEMNKLKEAAEGIGLPTFVVADAGRTQVSAGSKTVLAVGPAAALGTYAKAVDALMGPLEDQMPQDFLCFS